MTAFREEDKHLVERIIEGDEAAFKAMFLKYKNKLFSYCYRFTKSEELAEEIVHDVLVKVWVDRKKLNKHLSFSSFLYTVTHNLALNFLKKAAADESLKRKIALFFDKQQNITEETVVYADFQQMLKRAVDNLPPQQKLVFQLSRNEELTHEEIAEKMGISKNTVRNHMGEALKYIKSYCKSNADLSFTLGYLLFFYS